MPGDHSRRHAEELTEQQRKDMTHYQWLTEQVDTAFCNLEIGQTEFVSHDEARSDMEARKSRIRNTDQR